MTYTSGMAARRRREVGEAYTLVELIVVMAVIVILAGLLIVMWGGFGTSTAPQRNADKIQGMLLIAKMRALRDGRPTGVRLVMQNPLDYTSPCTQLIYIQQPDDFTPPVSTNNGVSTVAALQKANGGPPTLLTFSNTIDFTGGQPLPTDYLVQGAGGGVLYNASALGDYLEINGGPLHTIVYVGQPPSANTLIVKDLVTLNYPTTNWRVIRNPRPLAGEEPLDLSGTIMVDIGMSMNVPLRASQTDGTSPPVYYRDILFSPSGSVIGQGTSGNDKILLWVRDSTYANPVQGEPVLVGIQTGTGFIGGYTVDVSGADPYSNAHDPHASGM